MKTKKAILDWWEILGNKDFGNDYEDMLLKINDSLEIKRSNKDIHHFSIEIMNKKRWKFPLSLYFYADNKGCDCYRIVGF